MLIRVLLLLLAFASAFATAEPARVRVLILTGESDYSYHDWRSTTPFLRELLQRTGRFDVKAAEEVHGLDARALAPYDAGVELWPRWGRLRNGPSRISCETERIAAVHGVS
jgi:hypothetical protein